MNVHELSRNPYFVLPEPPFRSISLNKVYVVAPSVTALDAVALVIYAFIPGIMCGPINKPSAQLVYLYLRVSNVSPSAPYVTNRMVILFAAEIG